MNCRNCVGALLAVVFIYGQALAQETTQVAKASSRGNWPSWRGPHATGTTDEKDLPLTCPTKATQRRSSGVIAFFLRKLSTAANAGRS